MWPCKASFSAPWLFHGNITVGPNLTQAPVYSPSLAAPSLPPAIIAHTIVEEALSLLGHSCSFYLSAVRWWLCHLLSFCSPIHATSWKVWFTCRQAYWRLFAICVGCWFKGNSAAFQLALGNMLINNVWSPCFPHWVKKSNLLAQFFLCTVDWFQKMTYVV